MKSLLVSLVVVGLSGAVSCTHYTPKPRGYFRIEPEVARYGELPSMGLPYTFRVSHLSVVELSPAVGKSVQGIRLVYPSLGATVYGSYLPVTPATLGQAVDESRALLARQAKDVRSIAEKAYADPEKQVYGSLFLLDGGSASPIQFVLTDRASHFFRGALYFDCKPNADSLAPAVDYLRRDIIELIQSFNWKR